MLDMTIAGVQSLFPVAIEFIVVQQREQGMFGGAVRAK